MLLPEAEVLKLIAIKPGDTFSREALNDAIKRITDRLGNDGYAFANVNPVPETDKEKRQVAFNFLIDPGRRVYVRRINVSGNTRTRDEVIRRELRQLEGAYYDTEKLQQSKQRLERLGYFTEIDVETPPVPGTTDQVDASIKVKEKPTGNFLIGAGFSSSEKLTVASSISQDNIFGSGKSLSAAVNSSKVTRTYSLSTTDPYYTVDGVARGFDLYTRTADASRLGLGDYRTTSTGGGMRFGYPLTAVDRLNLGLSVEATQIKLGDISLGNVPTRFVDYVNTYGANSTSLIASGGWTRDSRDSVFWPTKGERRSLNIEATAPPGKQRYYKVSAQEQVFVTFARDYTIMLNGEIGTGDGYTGKPLPFFRNFYAGGMGSVRGYQPSALGPQDANGQILGGNRRIVGNAEFFFPVPGQGRDRQFRLSAFIDGGQVFGDGQKMNFSDIRYSAGVSAFWSSPLGPMKVSFGKPLNDKPGDKLQKFQFAFGQTF
jgi:outer membrane protein insertion porin family